MAQCNLMGQSLNIKFGISCRHLAKGNTKLWTSLDTKDHNLVMIQTQDTVCMALMQTW